MQVESNNQEMEATGGGDVTRDNASDNFKAITRTKTSIIKQFVSVPHRRLVNDVQEAMIPANCRKRKPLVVYKDEEYV
jgi:hypothetical protein